MAFLIFELTGGSEGSGVLQPTGEHFSLAGYNLIYEAWEKRSQPLDQGWHVSADELIRIDSNGLQTYDTRRMVIDFDPNARWRIGLIELLDIYAYTWGNGSGEVAWTPLMLRLRDVFYEEYDPEITDQQKNEIMQQLPEPNDDSDWLCCMKTGGAVLPPVSCDLCFFGYRIGLGFGQRPHPVEHGTAHPCFGLLVG